MGRDDGVLVIGGSAGGIDALVELVAQLPRDLHACVLVTVHIGGNARSKLPEILARSGPLPAAHARHGEPLQRGRIYVAPPDLHLLAADGAARLSSGPRVNRHRPAIDVMFASAARWAGPRVAAVVLSGLLDDGAIGSALVARAGGRVVVQDPADALFDSMPRSALFAVPDATAVPVARMGPVLVDTVTRLHERGRIGHGNGAAAGIAARSIVDAQLRGEEGGPVTHETRMGDSDDPGFLSADEIRLTRMSCPECNGGLAEIDLERLRYYRCHVGHQYSPQSLEAAQREAVEAKLWAAAAALEEHAALARHLATVPNRAVGQRAADGYRRLADESSSTATSLLSRLQNREGTPPAIAGDTEPKSAAQA
jgi:two-component system, chemotaxis family, protein-glutamate methylesterase/glutaminase